MGQVERRTRGDTTRLGVLSILSATLEAAGIPPDNDLIVEILPSVLLIDAEQPLWQVNWPYSRLFDDPGIEPEKTTAILEKGGYFDK